jgi:hypothetical protein
MKLIFFINFVIDYGNLLSAMASVYAQIYYSGLVSKKGKRVFLNGNRTMTNEVVFIWSALLQLNRWLILYNRKNEKGRLHNTS